MGFEAFQRGRKYTVAQKRERLAALQKGGFARAWHEGVTSRLEELCEARSIPQGLFIAVDRISIGEEGRNRLAEALETSFSEGQGFAAVIVEDGPTVWVTNRFACAECRSGYEKPVPRLFSFNNPFGACPACKGFGNILELSPDLVMPNRRLSLSEGAIEPFTKPSYEAWNRAVIEKAQQFGIDIGRPVDQLSAEEMAYLFEGGSGFPGIRGYFQRLEAKKYKLHVRVFLSRYKAERPCHECAGSRLNAAARRVQILGETIDRVASLSFNEFRDFLHRFEETVADPAATRILEELHKRTGYAIEVGIGYLTLDRLMRTLSGGEAQRIGLANQLGNGLTDTLYVLDEPTIGLHPHNTERLLHVLHDLADRGNTLVVVEHDPDVIREGDHIVELGPESGVRGGELVYAGPGKQDFLRADTTTARYLRGELEIPVPARRRKGYGQLKLTGARANNLRNVDLQVPLGTLTCVTGVSGSGKSTLVHQTLYGALARIFGIEYAELGAFGEIQGLNLIRGVVLVDQQPIGKTARSIPASYIGIYDDIRRLLSQTEDARIHGLKAGSFSFNVPGGRCERCGGMGIETVEMHFLSDLEMICEECSGTRFQQKVLDVRYKGKNVAEILALTVDDALRFFQREKRMVERLRLLHDVGLGYLTLGQSAKTLSGGESQRLKVASELGVRRQRTLYILDEPTTGLHMGEVKLLVEVLNKLVEKGHTVLVVEHNLDVIKCADYLIDMGPGGGDNGGRIVAEGTPEEVVVSRRSLTARHLRPLLKPRLV